LTGSGVDLEAANAALVPCSACGGRTREEPHRALVWVCAACGAPRVPGAPVEGLEGLAEGLGRARLERVAAIAWRGGAVVLGMTGAMALALATLLAMAAGHLAAIVLAGLATLLVVLALVAVGRARGRDEGMRRALDEAWGTAAERLLVASDGGVSSAWLAGAMRTTEAHAERILASLSARGRARVDVGEDAELRYRVADGSTRDANSANEGDERRTASRATTNR
jgi:hypothetical protein